MAERTIGEDSLPPSFHRTTSADGQPIYVSHVLAIVTDDLQYFKTAEWLRGGILAEEMGLGKTVELIALICLHKRQLVKPSSHSGPDHPADRKPLATRATLIITPPSILQQWMNEIATHAQSLKVYHYPGIGHDDGNAANEEILGNMMDADVVLTTYHVLSKEIHYADEKPDRKLRQEKKYIPRRSPLVQIEWWRLCLDEAQMVESGVSNAAKVARVIPRCNAWAVTGTPLKSNIADLHGLLNFLRYDPYAKYTSLWQRLVNSEDAFRRLFSQITLRHTKDRVRDELKLPPQKRVVVTVPFTHIEEQHYSQLYQQMCEDCGLDQDGSPISDLGQQDEKDVLEKMRTWLTRLRQTCLHPEVGGRNRRALGYGDKPLRTISEVLEVMINQNLAALRNEERTLLISSIRRGQLLENARRSRQALEIWLQVLSASETIVSECRTQLEQEIVKLRSLDATPKDHSRANPNDGADDDSSDDSDKDEVTGRPDADSRLGVYRSRLRSALEIEHMCVFFAASAMFQIKSNEEETMADSKEFRDLEVSEAQYYERAKLIRREMLQDATRRAELSVKKLVRKATSQSFVQVPEIPAPLYAGGIESRGVIEKMKGLAAILNDQANQQDEWREMTVKILTQRLVDEEEADAIKGDEYDISTRQQDDVYVYMEVLAAVLGDRQEALTGNKSNIHLKTHDARLALEKAERGEGHNPELMKALMSVRADVKPPEELGSLRGVLGELRTLKSALQVQVERGSTRASTELEIVEREFQRANSLWNNQTKAITALERELVQFQTVSNARLEFYRQLQQISDTVAPYEDPDGLDPQVRSKRLEESESKATKKLATLKSKQKYLEHLRVESSNKDAQRMCIICQQSFELGALTVCGHQYCKDCMRLWWNSHRSCPICKKHLTLNDIHQITYKPQELTVQEEAAASGTEEGLKDVSAPTIYSGISEATLVQIKGIDLDGSFGTKIDTLARHIFWIRANDHGAKSIVFSQYKDFLGVLERAFSRFKIGFSSIDRKAGIEKFRTDPGTECFLLHAKAHSSGLNLVNATHVILCEPLINTALELQAIARVQRIGQQRPTTVWMYLVSDTVEESIYDISVTRRLSHVADSLKGKTKRTSVDQMENSIDAANSRELQQAPMAKLLAREDGGGELVNNEDLWGCLFKKKMSTGTRADSSIALDPEVGRFLRADAAEERRGEVA
ncbi:MAG: hypothetical protein M1825_004732 [Sarcosagium campestre]|nr:MAG: hypothetical protein M1825_004732 [Sarcosagium campestre]